MALTYAQKQMAKRRSGDINRLTSDYQRAVEQFKSNVGTKETAFQGEMAKFNTAFSGFEQRSTAYQKRLLDYMDKMKAFQDKPEQTFREGRGYQFIPRLNAFVRRDQENIGGNRFSSAIAQGPFVGTRLNSGSGRQDAFTLAPGYEYVAEDGVSGFIVGKGATSPGEFTEKFDEQAPVAPAAMDISAERTALQGEKDFTEREIDERKKGRLRAVGRGTQRGMLSAGTNITAKA